MYKFIFEDNQDTPSSLLLKSSYNGNNISFSDGDNPVNVVREIEKCRSIDKDCEIIVFYDLPPNYERVYRSYEKLIGAIFEKGYTGVHIVPIICIEYYILNLLIRNRYLKVSDKNTDLVNNLILSFDFSNESVDKFINANEYRKESLEHVYKDLLKSLTVRSLCMSNHTQHDKNNTIKLDSYIGCFYRKDCVCDLKYCKSKCRVSLVEKAERFYVSLPIFDVLNDEHKKLLDDLEIEIRSIDFKSLYDDTYKFFDNLCNKMNIAMPLIARFD